MHDAAAKVLRDLQRAIARAGIDHHGFIGETHRLVFDRSQNACKMAFFVVGANDYARLHRRPKSVRDRFAFRTGVSSIRKVTRSPAHRHYSEQTYPNAWVRAYGL